ncbi:MAG: hypothetical protein A3F70_09010 [Acidobacteria bacterium RIFCSPLOWO2_12_FULL_67_14]|nr:MAG: hypothetical protein A3H29_12675 [Acidobacteria bacterium RIFCSPLOWO2_02_FULL_67_21]OFW40045.1 MAG: hypothetical protein A3F70_09010 [Acidobacteria bacterium RIFCSPLOWO2_12_FULL_67_14]
MTALIRRHMRATASATTAVLLTLVFVTCMPASAMMLEKSSCCAAMEHACGKPSVDMPCCSGQGDQVRALVAVKSTTVAASAPAPVDAAPVAYAPRLASPLAAAGSAPVHLRGSPAYLLISALRI